MKTQSIRVKLRDGEMGAYLAVPDRTPAGTIIAGMEIWGVNDTMRAARARVRRSRIRVPGARPVLAAGARRRALRSQSRAREEGIRSLLRLRLRPRRARHGGHLAFPGEAAGVQRQGRAVGYCLGGKLCYLMCCRTDIDCAVAYYGTYIEHRIREAKNLHRPFVLHMAMKDRWVQAEVNDLLERRLSPNPLVTSTNIPAPTTPSPATAARPIRSRRPTGRSR